MNYPAKTRHFAILGLFAFVVLVLRQPCCAQAQTTPPPPPLPPSQSSPVHIDPGSAPGAPGGVTPQQPPLAAPNPGARTPAPAPATAAKPAAADRPQLEITTQVNLVLVPVIVTDALNRMVTGLEKSNFTVSEDNTPQLIKTFSSEDAPISVGVVFDSSGSMSDKIQKSRDALLQFFRTSNPQDEFFLVDFADQPRLLTGFTSNIDQIEDSVSFLQAQGRTALLDAIYLALAEMRNARYSRKALLIISDGGDNHSRYTERDVQRVVREADVQIYGIGIYSPGYQSTQEEIDGPRLMAQIAEATGGRCFDQTGIDDLADVATKIGTELRNQYVIGYTPTSQTADGKWRKIQVKLHLPPGLPPVSVSARGGYYGPHP